MHCHLSQLGLFVSCTYCNWPPKTFEDLETYNSVAMLLLGLFVSCTYCNWPPRRFKILKRITALHCHIWVCLFRVHIVIDPPSCGQAIYSFTPDRGMTFAWTVLKKLWKLNRKLLEIVKEKIVEDVRNCDGKVVEVVRNCEGNCRSC